MSNFKLSSIMATFLGKQIKTIESKWETVKGSTQKLTASALKQVKNITIKVSDFDDNKLYAHIELKTGYVNFTVDSTCPLEEGDRVDPSTVRVYKLTNGQVTIERLWAEKL